MRNLCPAVFFVFSIKKIDEYAMFLSENDFNDNKADEAKITRFFDKCMKLLSVLI